jgi:hypothetical protein
VMKSAPECEVKRVVEPYPESSSSEESLDGSSLAMTLDGESGMAEPGDPEVEEPEWSSSAVASTPVRMLEREYERCMRMNAEELDLEPAVYIHEGMPSQ